MIQRILPLYILSFCLLLLTGCQQEEKDIPRPEEITDAEQYFLDVGFGNELGDGYSHLRKWEEDIRIYVPQTSHTELLQELDRIISDINSLSATIQLRRVESESASNYLIYFGDKDTYVSDYESNAAGHVEENYGFFWVYWNSSFQINRGSMYVDIERTEEVDCRKHLLREELTQSLGLMNDSDQYPESIFYQPWTCTTGYSDIDTQLLRLLMSEDLGAGMARSEVEESLRKQ